MKKTLVAILALGGMAMAAEPITTLNSETTHADLTNTTAAYIAAVMNMDTFATLVTNQTSDCLVTFNLTGRTDITKVGAGTVSNTLKGTHLATGQDISSAVYTPNPNGISDLKGTLDFDSLAGAVLTFAYDKGEGSRIILTTLDKQGVYTDYVGEINGLKWSNTLINGANIDATYVTTANVYGGTWKDNMGDLKATAHSLITVPEPATATLSLLALAGLAARRRRH